MQETHKPIERIGAVGLGTLFVILGAIPMLKGEGQVMYASIVLIALGTPLIYRGLGYGLPPFLEGLLVGILQFRQRGDVGGHPVDRQADNGNREELAGGHPMRQSGGRSEPLPRLAGHRWGNSSPMREVYRGPWGPPRVSTTPRNLPEGAGLDYLMAHAEELVGTELVLAETPDPVVPGPRFNAAWLDEDGLPVAQLTNEPVTALRWIEDLRARAEQVLGVEIDRPRLN